MSWGLGAFANGLAQGRDTAQRMMAQAEAAKAAKAQQEQGAAAPGQTASPAGVPAPSLPAGPVQQPAQQSYAAPTPSFGEGSSMGLGAFASGLAHGQGVAKQAAAKSAATTGDADPFGGAWSALKNALGMQSDAPQAAATGMTQAAAGTAEAQQKTIFPTN